MAIVGKTEVGEQSLQRRLHLRHLIMLSVGGTYNS